MLSKEHYCCKINKFVINEKQCFIPKTLNSLINRLWGMGGGGGGGGGEGGGVHTVIGAQMT